MISFSIIIPCRSVSDYLKESVEYIKVLDYKSFEVLVVLDEDTDYDFNDSRFRVLVSGSVGPAEKRNLGAKNAKGEVLAFLDDDAYPEKSWLHKAAEIFSNTDVYALGGPAITPENANPLEVISGKIFESKLTSGGVYYRYTPGKSRLIADYPTVNFFVRKESFDSVGGFDSRYWPGEDTKLCLDLVKKMGRKFNYNPEILVYHHRREIFLSHLKQISRYGKFRGQFAKIYPETSRLPMYFVPSMFVVGLIAGYFLSLLFASITPIYLGALTIYSITLLLEALGKRDKSSESSFIIYFMIGVFLTHLVYGTNFILGYIKKPMVILKKYNIKTGNYSEG